MTVLQIFAEMGRLAGLREREGTGATGALPADVELGH
jgi:hypothetical protein